MSWLPFICLVLGMGVLTVLYKGTVGHTHHMVHQLDEAIGIHEARIVELEDSLVVMTDLLAKLSELAKQHMQEQQD